MITITVGTGYTISKWVAFVIALLWTSLLLWDIVFKPALFPEVSLTEQDRIEMAAAESFQTLLTQDSDRLHREVQALKLELTRNNKPPKEG
jgi:hypothetical protein